MKKILIFLSIFIILFVTIISVIPKTVYAETSITNQQGNLMQLKKDQLESMEQYKQKYGSDSYGVTAYILHIVQIYSIPFCFLGIVISIIYKVIIGARNLENAEKGLGMIVAIVTLTIICQVLPLVFAIVVKLGRE